MAQIEVPQEVVDAGVSDWFQALNDPDKVKVRRYLQGIDTSSVQAFVTELMRRCTEDHNYKLSVSVGSFARQTELDDYSRFLVNEAYIEGLFGAERFDEAKEACCENLDLYPSVKDRFIADNGGSLPKLVSCRNRLVDIAIGVESQYDSADEILSAFVELGLLDEEEKAFRMQSIKIHRMQKTFDNVFNYRPKQ